MKHRIPHSWSIRLPAFVRTHIHYFTANEKDFSLSLEMTVRGSGILFLPHAGNALVQGHGSTSFLWKEVPQRGGGWLTQRNKKEWVRSIFSYRHPEHSRGIFAFASSAPALLIRLHETPYPHAAGTSPLSRLHFSILSLLLYSNGLKKGVKICEPLYKSC